MRRMVFEWRDRIGVTILQSNQMQGEPGGWEVAGNCQADTFAGSSSGMRAVPWARWLSDAAAAPLCSRCLLLRSPRQQQGGAARQLEKNQGREAALQ